MTLTAKMKNEPQVTSYVLLRNNEIIYNDQVVYSNQRTTSADFLNSAYEFMEINYPKFFKMDNLCKTGFLAAEILLRTNNGKEKFQPEETGIIFSNANSSLDTDIRYNQTIASAPSPSLFVYTLPNILIAEICIRHCIKGESACFVFDIFDASFQAEYINDLFATGRIKTCLSGWADYYDGKAEAFFYLAEPTGQDMALKHDLITLDKIFQTHE